MKELIGRKVIGFRWESDGGSLGWMGEMEESIGQIGTIEDYEEYDNSFQIKFPDSCIFWHPGNEVIKHLVEEEVDKLTQITNLYNELLNTLERDNTIPNEIVITNKELFLKSWRRELDKIIK